MLTRVAPVAVSAKMHTPRSVSLTADFQLGSLNAGCCGGELRAHLWAATQGLPAATRMSQGPSAAAAVTAAASRASEATTIMLCIADLYNLSRSRRLMIGARRGSRACTRVCLTGSQSCQHLVQASCAGCVGAQRSGETGSRKEANNLDHTACIAPKSAAVTLRSAGRGNA